MELSPIPVSLQQEIVPGAGPAPAPPANAGATYLYPPPAAIPTQAGPRDIRFDFNFGARALLPRSEHGRWRVRLRDLDTGNILFESENQGALVSSAKRWFVRFRIEIWDVPTGDEQGGGAGALVLSHDY